MEDSTSLKRRNPPPPTIAETLTDDVDVVVKEDRISDLPDSVLSHILSKLPTKTAIATTVLSTKWKHLFASIPNLSLEIDDAVSNPQHNPDFVNFMHHLLTVTLRDVPCIRKFRLHCHHDYGNSHIDAWISTVLGLKVSSLTLFFGVKDTGVSIESPFQCETLVDLSWCQDFYAKVPDRVCLPNLKRLYLAFVKFPDYDPLGYLISGCPVLELLFLDRCKFEDIIVLGICSSSLRFLMLSNCNHDNLYQVVFATPLLEILEYNDRVATSYWEMNLNSLIRASIDVGPSDKQLEMVDDEAALQLDQNVAELVAACCNVDFLYLSMPTVTGFMEHEGCFTKFESSISNFVPSCLSLHLQRIYFEEFNGEQDELKLVSYFLMTAEVLREMEFSFCSSLPIGKQHGIYSTLKSLEGCSKSKNCKIRFANGISMLESSIE